MTYEIESTPEEAFLELVSPETGSVHELQKEQLADAVHSLPALAEASTRAPKPPQSPSVSARVRCRSKSPTS